MCLKMRGAYKTRVYNLFSNSPELIHILINHSYHCSDPHCQSKRCLCDRNDSTKLTYNISQCSLQFENDDIRVFFLNSYSDMGRQIICEVRSVNTDRSRAWHY